MLPGLCMKKAEDDKGLKAAAIMTVRPDHG